MRPRDTYEALAGRAAEIGTSVADAALALGITVVVALELSTTSVHAAPLVTVMAVPALLTVAWRRRRPVEVAVAVGMCALHLALNLVTHSVWGVQFMALPVTLSVYTLAAHTAGRRAWLGGAATVTLMVAAQTATEEGDLADFIPLLTWGAAWLAGRVVRRRTLEAARIATDALQRAHDVEVEARETRASERDRIARELHDVVAHGVSLMVVQAGAERLALGDSSPRTRDALDAIESAGRQALTELRTMLAVLRSPDDDAAELGPQPDLGALPMLVSGVRDAGLPVELSLDVSAETPAGVGLSAYRIVQEALTNALKHGAPSASVVVRDVAGELVVEVRSRLTGSTPSTAGAGRGLVGMRERVALHGGSLQAGPDVDEWAVLATLPLSGAMSL